MEPELDTDASPENSVADQDTSTSNTDGDSLVEEELLVEEISIDGMCGVY